MASPNNPENTKEKPVADKDLAKASTPPLVPPAPVPAAAPAPATDMLPSLAPGEIVRSSLGQEFEVIVKLGAGSFGAVYKVRDIKAAEATKNIFAMKTESTSEKTKVLKMEVCVLKAIEQAGGRHFCRIVARGRNERYLYVVMTLVGPSLSDMRKMYGASHGRRFRAPTALRVAVQMLESIEDMHSVGYIHRDVKPANFAVGRPEAHELKKVYILDFGLCRRYRKNDGNLRLPREVANFRGTIRYAPVNSHLKRDLSRKDDLETWMYTVIELTSGSLPWIHQRERHEVGLIKKAAREGNTRRDLLLNCPNEYGLILDYADSLEYWEEPDYDYIYKLLRRAMHKHKPSITDNDLFDWESETNNNDQIAADKATKKAKDNK